MKKDDKEPASSYPKSVYFETDPEPRELGTPEDFEKARKYIKENTTGCRLPDYTPYYDEERLPGRVYLGSINNDCGICDLYAYWTERERTVLVRYGSGGSQYISGVELVHLYPELNVALQLGIKAGIIPWEIAYPAVLRRAMARDDIAVLRVVEAIVYDASTEKNKIIGRRNNATSLLPELRVDFRNLWNRMHHAGLVQKTAPGFSFTKSDDVIDLKWDDPRLVNVEGSLRTPL